MHYYRAQTGDRNPMTVELYDVGLRLRVYVGDDDGWLNMSVARSRWLLKELQKALEHLPAKADDPAAHDQGDAE